MLTRRLVPAVAALLLVAGPARADTVLTDPAGDAGRCTGFCLTPTVASDPALDIVSVDVDLDGRTLSVGTTVADLGLVSTGPLSPKGEDDVTYEVTFRQGSLWIGIYAQRTYGHAGARGTLHAYDFGGNGVNAFRSVPVTFDHATSTVRVDVPRATLDDAVAEACPSCSPLRRGDHVDGLHAASVAWITLHTGAVAGSGYVGYSNVDVTDHVSHTLS